MSAYPNSDESKNLRFKHIGQACSDEGDLRFTSSSQAALFSGFCPLSFCAHDSLHAAKEAGPEAGADQECHIQSWWRVPVCKSTGL